MHRPQILSELPTPLPENYRDWINTPDPAEELKSVRHSITKGIPYGGESWQQQMIDEYDLEQTTRSPGRPRKD